MLNLPNSKVPVDILHVLSVPFNISRALSVPVDISHVLSVPFLFNHFPFIAFYVSNICPYNLITKYSVFHFYVPMFSSLALQPKVGLGHFIHPPPGKFRGFGRSFVTNTFYWAGLSAPLPILNLEDQDNLYCVGHHL
jgi:hypothetical protein